MIKSLGFSGTQSYISQMIYMYILRSLKDPSHIYYGQTNNPKRRLAEHNAGENLSTIPYRPWKIIYYEAYASRSLALAREKQLKYYGQARTALKKRLGLNRTHDVRDQWNRIYDPDPDE